jgi:transposase
MAIGADKDLTDIQRFFLEPAKTRHRQYEALRAYFVEGLPSAEVAARFGYRDGSFRMLCHAFRRDPDPEFFVTPRVGPRTNSRKLAAREQVVALRKKNHSVYEISDILKEDYKIVLSPTAVREVLRQEGFAPLPRRRDDERPQKACPTVEPVADARMFAMSERRFTTACGGLFLFIPDLVRLGIDGLAEAARLPGSKMIPAPHALRSALALKLWSIERKSHVMSLVADPGLALFAGLNAIPKKSYLSEYSHRISHAGTTRVLAGWHDALAGDKLFTGESFNLDFHSVPYFGEDPTVEKHYVSMRSRRQPSILAFLAQDAASRAFCYSNADLRKGEETEEIFRFIDFWQKHHGRLPRHLVFDSKLTTHAALARLDAMGIDFITLRRRSRKLLAEIATLPRSAWRTIELEGVTRKFRTPRVYDKTVTLAGCSLRQLYIQDLGHDEPTILLTNQRTATLPRLITRYAQRMLIENALSDSVRFFHMNALSSAVGMKVDFDMVLLVIASGLYRLFASGMRGYAEAQARQIFRDLVQMPAEVTVSPEDVRVHFHRRAHLPILLASGIFAKPVAVPWWDGARLSLTA